MKLDVNALRYLSKDEFRVLTAVEMGMKNVSSCIHCFWTKQESFELLGDPCLFGFYQGSNVASENSLTLNETHLSGFPSGSVGMELMVRFAFVAA